MLQAHLPPSAIVEKTEIAGAGFINFFLADHAYSGLVSEIIESTLDWTRLRVASRSAC